MAQLTPRQVLARDKREAVRVSTLESRRKLRRLLAQAQQQLERRIAEAVRLRADQTFTAAQARVVVRQVEAAQRELHAQMSKLTVSSGKSTAARAAADVVDYLKRAERMYRGVARPLPIRTAMVVDRSTADAESSVLHRIETDPAHPRRRGVLDRYDAGVIADFEEQVQLRLLTRAPWEEARRELVRASPFLQDKPLSWAERILRTETMHAHNRASWEAMRESQEVLGDMLRVLSATFDSRTASDSYAVHGQIRRVNEPFESWRGKYMHPPNRPNDREVVVPHRMSWPLPAALEPRSDAEVAARWQSERRKGSPPPRPNMSTVDREKIGKVPPPAPRPQKGAGQPPPPATA